MAMGGWLADPAPDWSVWVDHGGAYLEEGLQADQVWGWSEGGAAEGWLTISATYWCGAG